MTFAKQTKQSQSDFIAFADDNLPDALRDALRHMLDDTRITLIVIRRAGRALRFVRII